MEISFTAAKKTDTRTDKDWTLIKIESAVPWQKDQVFGTWNLMWFDFSGTSQEKYEKGGNFCKMNWSCGHGLIEMDLLMVIFGDLW